MSLSTVSILDQACQTHCGMKVTLRPQMFQVATVNREHNCDIVYTMTGLYTAYMILGVPESIVVTAYLEIRRLLNLVLHVSVQAETTPVVWISKSYPCNKPWRPIGL
jgi:hypothetical protein